MRIVVVLGDIALLRRGESPDGWNQRRNVKSAVAALAEMARDDQLIVTYGSAPQVGLSALQGAACDVAAYPLDMLSAESEGMIGYLLEQELAGELPGARVATLLTRVVVDPGGPEFRRPTKPIGPLYDEAGARRLTAGRGWLFQPDGSAYRRVVPAPEPLRILEIDTIRLLIEAGVLVVCAGGGGIPVAVDAGGVVRGVEAVVDKDLSAALLAILVDADRLLLLTDATAVWTGWQTPHARQLSVAGPSALRAIDLAAGSMGIKAEAACRFVEATGRSAAIGALADAARVLAGEAGTTITIAEPGLRWRSDQAEDALACGDDEAGVTTRRVNRDSDTGGRRSSNEQQRPRPGRERVRGEDSGVEQGSRDHGGR
jgi:carbamate kinase